MATRPQTGLSYADLAAFPEDNLRRELIGGELIVTAAPRVRHQRAVMTIARELSNYSLERGGEAFPAPTDVFFSDIDVVEPDVIFVTAENKGRVEERVVRGAPDIVVEVSSPTTRHLEVVRKRDLYERYGVPEYWYVDLEAERIEVYRREGERFAPPVVLERGGALGSILLPGFSVDVGAVLGVPD